MAGEDVVVTDGPSGDAEPKKAERNDEMEEVEDEGERDDGEGLGNALPAARVKRIMRKNPDKKKNFSKDTVLAVSMATVSIDITCTKIPALVLPRLRVCVFPLPFVLAPTCFCFCCCLLPSGRCAGTLFGRHCQAKPRVYGHEEAQDHAAGGYWCVCVFACSFCAGVEVHGHTVVVLAGWAYGFVYAFV